MSCNHKRDGSNNKNVSNSYPTAPLGFTLIELMISLVLGLLISAAVIQVYIVNTRTLTVQQSASEVQDSTIFALQSLNDHIRIANLGNPITSITDGTANGGIVLTAKNVNNNTDIKTAYMTVSAGQAVTAATKGWTGISNINDIASDQMTIQYRNVTPNSLYDCEGAEVTAGSSGWVIERYFVRLAPGASPKTGVQELALACDAGSINSAGTVTNFGDDGTVIIPAVEQFKVLLGALTDINNLTYLPAKTYLELTSGVTEEKAKPAITTVKLGVIVRSDTPLITDSDKDEFTVLGTKNVLKTDTARKKYYRRSYESTVLLRNARVMSVTGVPANNN